MYTISYPSGTIRLDGIAIQQDVREPEWNTYVAWLEAGNGPVVMQDTPALERIEVSAWQIRKALNSVPGLRQSVEDAVAASDDITLKDGWLHSPTFYSDQPLTLQMGASLGMTTEQMYDLFTLAKGL